jgi:hypothetical protein
MSANPTAHRFPAKLVKGLAAFLVTLLWLWSAGFVAATAGSLVIGLLAFAVFPLALVFVPAPRRRVVVAVFGAFASVALILFFMRRPSNDRDWEEDQAVLPVAEFARSGDGRVESVLVRNIRNFRYRSANAGDWEPQRYDKRFDLSREGLGKFGGAVRAGLLSPPRSIDTGRGRPKRLGCNAGGMLAGPAVPAGHCSLCVRPVHGMTTRAPELRRSVAAGCLSSRLCDS